MDHERFKMFFVDFCTVFSLFYIVPIPKAKHIIQGHESELVSWTIPPSEGQYARGLKKKREYAYDQYRIVDSAS
jgi:hypothetical protein